MIVNSETTSISSMGAPHALRRHGFWRRQLDWLGFLYFRIWPMQRRFGGVLVPHGITRRVDIALAGFEAGELLGRPRDAVERSTEIRQLDHRPHEADDPEDVHVRKQRDQAEYRDEFGLHLVGLVRDVFGQRMQAEEEHAEAEHREQQDARHRHHQDVGLTRRRDEHQQMLNRDRMNGFACGCHARRSPEYEQPAARSPQPSASSLIVARSAERGNELTNGGGPPSLGYPGD